MRDAEWVGVRRGLVVGYQGGREYREKAGGCTFTGGLCRSLHFSELWPRRGGPRMQHEGLRLGTNAVRVAK